MTTKKTAFWCSLLALLAGTVSWAATATFVPSDTTSVLVGESISFDIILSVDQLPSFDAADIVIGSIDASDLSFGYSPEWEAAFQQVTPPQKNVGLYNKDIFVGGNNPTPVSLPATLGTVTIDTTGMTEGMHEIRIDADVAPDVSSVILKGVHEALSGTISFNVVCLPFDPECDSDVDLGDYSVFRECALGPGADVPESCARFKTDGDADVDLAEISEFMKSFTGSK